MWIKFNIDGRITLSDGTILYHHYRGCMNLYKWYDMYKKERNLYYNEHIFFKWKKVLLNKPPKAAGQVRG